VWKQKETLKQQPFFLLFCTLLQQCRINVHVVAMTFRDESSFSFEEPMRATGSSLSGCMAEVTAETSVNEADMSADETCVGG